MSATHFLLDQVTRPFDENAVMAQAENCTRLHAGRLCGPNQRWKLEGVVTDRDRSYGSIKTPHGHNAWNRTWDMAAQVVASNIVAEIDPGYSLLNRSRQTILEWMRSKLPQFLSKTDETVLGDTPAAESCANDDPCHLQIETRRLYQDMLCYDLAPFARCTPETGTRGYRALDLTNFRTGNAIIMVNVYS